MKNETNTKISNNKHKPGKKKESADNMFRMFLSFFLSFFLYLYFNIFLQKFFSFLSVVSLVV